MMKTTSPIHTEAARPHRAIRGVAAVEFALLLVPMALLLVGVAEFGRALYQYNTLVKSVRDSARVLTLYNPADADYPLDYAKCLAVFGSRCDKEGKAQGQPLLPGLTMNMVIVCNPTTAAGCSLPAYGNISTGSGTINLVEVRIHGYEFNSLIPLLPQAHRIVFNDIHVTMRQIL